MNSNNMSNYFRKVVVECYSRLFQRTRRRTSLATVSLAQLVTESIQWKGVFTTFLRLHAAHTNCFHDHLSLERTWRRRVRTWPPRKNNIHMRTSAWFKKQIGRAPWCSTRNHVRNIRLRSALRRAGSRRRPPLLGRLSSLLTER